MGWTKVLICVVLSILYATSCQAGEKVKRQDISDVAIPDENEDTVASTTTQPEVTGGKQQQQVAAVAGVKVFLPVVLPPANRSNDQGAVAFNFTKVLANPCLLYLEGINIFVWKSEDTPTFRHAVIGNAGFDSHYVDKNISYYWDETSVNCAMNNDSVGESRFTITIQVDDVIENARDEGPELQFTVDLGPDKQIVLELVFTGNYHSWALTSLTSRNDITITPAAGSQIPDQLLVFKGPFTIPTATNNITGLPAIGSWYQYGYACSQTPAIFYPTPVNNKWFIGFGFINMQVDLKAYAKVDDAGKQILVFNRDVSDCIGTFSVGSWMGIFCSLVLASVLMFGYLMLQSVQTMDRFDDPKQKQIVINFKE